MKDCFKCGATKPYTDFYTHKGMKDGFLNKCKACTKRDAKEHRSENIEYYRKYDRDRHVNDQERRRKNHANSKKWRKENPSRHVELTKRWRVNNPEKHQAHKKVSNALRNGKLIKMCCQVCGDENTQAHHADYSRPLDVDWLCKRHHDEAHMLQRKEEREK